MVKRINQQRGFTLLELLMVVIIIGILASLALPGFIKAAERARTAEVVTILGQIKGAAQRYCVQSDGTPPGGYGEMDIEDVTTMAGLSARWEFTLGTDVNIVCADASGTPFSVKANVKRLTGPCTGSTVDYDSTSANPATYTWAGSCA